MVLKDEYIVRLTPQEREFAEFWFKTASGTGDLATVAQHFGITRSLTRSRATTLRRIMGKDWPSLWESALRKKMEGEK